MSLFNKKEKFTFNLDKDLYAKFCVSCAQTSVDNVIENLIREYLKEEKPSITKEINIFRTSKDEFKNYLTTIATKSTGDHYSNNVANSYSVAINNASKYYNENLWAVKSSEQMSELLSKFQKDPEFESRDQKTARSLSNGLKRYLEFLEHKENK